MGVADKKRCFCFVGSNHGCENVLQKDPVCCFVFGIRGKTYVGKNDFTLNGNWWEIPVSDANSTKSRTVSICYVIALIEPGISGSGIC